MRTIVKFVCFVASGAIVASCGPLGQPVTEPAGVQPDATVVATVVDTTLVITTPATTLPPTTTTIAPTTTTIAPTTTVAPTVPPTVARTLPPDDGTNDMSISADEYVLMQTVFLSNDQGYLTTIPRASLESFGETVCNYAFTVDTRAEFVAALAVVYSTTDQSTLSASDVGAIAGAAMMVMCGDEFERLF